MNLKIDFRDQEITNLKKKIEEMQENNQSLRKALEYQKTQTQNYRERFTKKEQEVTLLELKMLEKYEMSYSDEEYFM